MTEFDKITTRGGDGGESSLVGGDRRRKDDLIFETMGTIDELSSFLGAAKAECAGALAELSASIEQIQKDLLLIGAQLAIPVHDRSYEKAQFVTQGDVDRLETEEAAYLSRSKIGDRFILPGETRVAAQLDVARAVARRAERKVVTCIRDRSMVELAPAQRYINRLSDFLFVIARFAAQTK